MILEARHIRKSFVGVKALSDANFLLREGEICGLVGANGSGKTTFARIVSGLLTPDGGELLLFGSPVNFRSRQDAERSRMAMVHQNLSLVPDLTIWENIALGREKADAMGFLDNASAVATAEGALSAIGVELSPHERVANISPDEKQLVEIAKAFAKNPRILILDEPTASLDFHQVDALFAAVQELKKRGVAIIFISHRIWEVARICDRLVAFRNGETVGELDFATQPRDQSLIVPLITGAAARTRVRTDRVVREEEIAEPGDTGAALEVAGVSLPDGRLKDISFTPAQGRSARARRPAGAGTGRNPHDPRRLSSRVQREHPRRRARRAAAQHPAGHPPRDCPHPRGPAEGRTVPRALRPVQPPVPQGVDAPRLFLPAAPRVPRGGGPDHGDGFPRARGPEADGGAAFRRQPAEGRHGKMAVAFSPGSSCSTTRRRAWTWEHGRTSTGSSTISRSGGPRWCCTPATPRSSSTTATVS